MKKLIALLLAAVMVFALCACGSSADSGKLDEILAAVEDLEASVAALAENGSAAAPAEAPAPAAEAETTASSGEKFYIWAWNTDFVTILDEVLPEVLTAEELDRIEFVNQGDSGTYQDAIDGLLADSSNEQYPDIILLEVGYVQKYVQSGALTSLADLGISAGDMANMYDYNISLGTDAATGETYAAFWQATPGAWQIRADLAEKYLGTTDPDELQAMLGTWEDVVAVSEKVSADSDGMVKLLSGPDDLKYVFCNGARDSAWYDENDVITIDPAIEEYLALAGDLAGLTFDVNMWSDEWAGLKDGDGESSEAVIAFTGCPWYSYWCLTDTWNDNTILIQGPQAYYWGGTGLAATEGCSDPALAAKIIKAVTCDADTMVKINTANGDYVNNAEAIAYIQEHGSGTTSTFSTYNDQDIIGFYADKCDAIKVLAVGEDQVICENILPTIVSEYVANGDMDAAISDLKAAIHDAYPYLSVD